MGLDPGQLDRFAQFKLPTPLPPTCPSCGYNLTGLVEPRCPECGQGFHWQFVEKKARMQWLEALGLKSLPSDVRFGFWLAVAAWGWTVLWLLVELCLTPASLPCCVATSFAWLVQVFMLVCSTFLCSRFVQFLRLPQEAREALRLEVPSGLAWSGLIASWSLLGIDLILAFLTIA